MSAIDDVLAVLQAHVLACTSVTVKAAPNYPVDDAGMLPMAITYIANGTAQADNATTVRMLFDMRVDVHFDRTLIKQTYMQISKFVTEFIKRMCGDPRLGNTVSTINFPLDFTVGPAEFNGITTQVVSFRVPIKITDSFGSSVITEISDYIVTEG